MEFENPMLPPSLISFPSLICAAWAGSEKQPARVSISFEVGGRPYQSRPL